MLILIVISLLNIAHAETSADRGKSYLENTYAKIPEYTRAKMNCTNCHLNGGKTPGTAPWLGIDLRYPKFSERDDKMESLADRVNDCFKRSMNGKALPKESQIMKDILAYMKELSQGYKKGEKIKGEGIEQISFPYKPDLAQGKALYQVKCMSCHQPRGGGVINDGKVIIPPIWGKYSFNIGAGMARLYTAAGFIKAKMPYGQGDSLSDEEAYKIAAYITQQFRPDFPGKSKDWPKGHKPKDARY